MREKICKKCKHYKDAFITSKWGGFGKIICTRDLAINIVTGEKDVKENSLGCYAEREDALRLEQFRCGVEGKFYEPK